MDSIEALRQAIAVAPDDFLLRISLGRRLAAAGRQPEALGEMAIASQLASSPDEVAMLQRCLIDIATVGSSGDEDSSANDLETPAARPADAERVLGSTGEDVDVNAEYVPEVERPAVTLDDVAGLDDVKRHIDTKVFAPLRNPSLARRFGRVPHGGLLLWGPPGCGKTFIARALAGSLDIAFCSVGLDEILGMYVGDSEKGLARLFEKTRHAAPSVLFIDEFDALGGQRAHMGTNRAYRSLVSGLLVELDGVGRSNDGVFTIGATNMPWEVDPALRRPGRFDRTVFIPPPDATAIAAILAARLASVPLSTDVNVVLIAGTLRGRSGADVRAVADRAIDTAFNASIEAGSDVPVTQRHLLEAARSSGSSIQSWIAQATVVAEASHDVDMFAPFLTWLDRR